MQKFFRGHHVKITDKLPKSMSHFECDCEAIIDHSYSDMYDSDGGHDKNYAVLIMPSKDMDSWEATAWYKEDQLTLINKDRDAGEKILQKHKAYIRKKTNLPD